MVKNNYYILLFFLVALRADRLVSMTSGTKKTYNPALYSDQNAEAMAIKELSNKLRLLEYDYSALHNKRLQDVSNFSVFKILFYFHTIFIAFLPSFCFSHKKCIIHTTL